MTDLAHLERPPTLSWGYTRTDFKASWNILTLLEMTLHIIHITIIFSIKCTNADNKTQPQLTRLSVSTGSNMDVTKKDYISKQKWLNKESGTLHERPKFKGLGLSGSNTGHTAQSEIQLNILATGSIQSSSLKGAANIGTCVGIVNKDIFPINMHQSNQISPLWLSICWK